MSDINALPDIIRQTIADEVRKQLPLLLPKIQPDEERARQMREICAKEYLTKRELGIYLSVSESHIDNVIASDDTFPVSRFGNSVRFKRTKVDEYVEKQGMRKRRS